MRVVRLQIDRFRSINTATLFPAKDNVYLGPNNIGKTAILEALSLLLNPEIGSYGQVIDENDFYLRQYRLPIVAQAAAAPAQLVADLATAPAPPSPPPDAPNLPSTPPHPPPPQTPPPAVTPPSDFQYPVIRIEAVIVELAEEDWDEFPAGAVLPWNQGTRSVVESTEEGKDPFEGAERAIRVCFEGWFDPDEDAFDWKTFFRSDPNLPRDQCPPVNRLHKRRIGFLIYRDFRALQRPITLEPFTLFGRLLDSQDATPKNFESVLDSMKGVAAPLFGESNFARVIAEYREELLRYLPLAAVGDGKLHIEATDRTREEVKAATQIYVNDAISLPLQKMGAGTRSLAVLAILLLIARKRGRGIIALEEPETFLFPHAQRRVIDEVLSLASQTFVTTHSPYVLERMPLDGLQRLVRKENAELTSTPLVTNVKTARSLRERFRRQLSEALLGTDVVIVEEDTTRLWLLRASALCHREIYQGTKLEAWELQGISIVVGQGNGDFVNLAPLLRRAGFRVYGFLDQVKQSVFDSYVLAAPDSPLVFHSKMGLEDLLLKELPKNLLKLAMTKGEHAKHHYSEAAVNAWDSVEFNERACSFFQNNKHIPFHEWLMAQVDFNTLPGTFKEAIYRFSRAVSGVETITTCTILI